ncbi:SDR family NAD(P)-dependent oxidoreductase [Peredibacter starrii]|uniref:SDR family oxidoreductase n=1 Tax=Peredibacter starrii TaxID=28202 RepID=A0AAX4HM51_9BACT|nr:SDR family oxidoreductase [Peredibacter starrii]WPU64275.1 SDR family oxidoreductase [Peredibacter starrii]
MTVQSNGRLLDKVAIITGAGTGIGEAIAHKFFHEGAKIVACGLKSDPVLDVVNKINSMGGKAVPFQGDLSQEQTAKAAIDFAISEFGRIDVLVNNAGVFLFAGETQEYETKSFDETILNNIRTVFLMTKYALPHLQKSKGNIIAAGSEAGEIGIPYNTVYGGTKAWVHAFIEGVAVEQAKYSVRANCVCPGPVDTAWTHRQSGPMNLKMEKSLIAATPMGRRGTVEEIANVYAFLASDEASFVTGALWFVDGGITKSKGPIGLDALGKDVRDEPEGKILKDLEHTQDGLKNKNYKSA